MGQGAVGVEGRVSSLRTQELSFLAIGGAHDGLNTGVSVRAVTNMGRTSVLSLAHTISMPAWATCA